LPDPHIASTDHIGSSPHPTIEEPPRPVVPNPLCPLPDHLAGAIWLTILHLKVSSVLPQFEKAIDGLQGHFSPDDLKSRLGEVMAAQEKLKELIELSRPAETVWEGRNDLGDGREGSWQRAKRGGCSGR